MKPTDRIKIDPVPLYEESSQTIEEYLEVLKSYCFTFHTQSKMLNWSTKEEAINYWTKMIKASYEPQYRIIRDITLSKEVTGKGVYDIQSTAKIFSDIEDLRNHRKSLMKHTVQRTYINSSMEALYIEGYSASEVVDILIEQKQLKEYDDKNNPIDHVRTVQRHFKKFKNFDVIRKSKQ